MKCPNCGEQIQEGKLYCEKCGREIQIVPEYEPEIENSIHTSLSNVATEITAPGELTTEKQSQSSETPEEAEGAEGAEPFWPPGKKQIRLILFLVLLGIISGGIYIALQFMPNYQYSLGSSALQDGKYRQALSRLERASKLSPNNVSYLNALASCYYGLEEYEASEDVCRHVIELEGSNEEAYRRLILILEKQEAYQQISELLRGCQDREIRNLYTDYLASPPEFDVPGGTYYETLSVKLISNASGTIYYTTDGSDPDETSEIYTTPIPLEAGRYTIKAFLVNSYGIKSDIAQESYYVDVHVPDVPVVSPASGEYDIPVQIVVDVPEDCRVFYTTDTSDPGTESTPYEAPVWMPSGYSVFRFVAVSPGGVKSEVAEVSYTLNLHPVLSTEAALNRLLLSLRNAGVLRDLLGNLDGKKGHNIYTYKYALVINDNRYYFYREYYEEAAGVSNATGKDYVVNYISGECYEAITLDDGTYRLLQIEEMPEDVTEEAETEENEPQGAER